MRQILRLLHGGNKHNLFLILSLPLNQSPWAKGWLYQEFWEKHTAFFKTPTPGREMATGGDNLGSLQPRGPSKQQMRSSTACCWQTQQPKRHVRTHYVFSLCFSTWCLPAGGLQVMAREQAEGFQKLFVYFWRHADEQREWGKAKAKTNVQSLAWLVLGYKQISGNNS